MPVLNTNNINAALTLLGGPATVPTTAPPAPTTSDVGANIGGLIGRVVTGGSATGDAIGSILGTIGGGLLTGRANVPMPAATSIVPAVVGTAGRAMMSGAVGELGAMGMRMLFGGGMRVRPGTARALRSLVPHIGLESAAMALGLSIGDAARVFSRRRRSRGISAADLRRTRSTLRKISTIQRNLSSSGVCRRRR